MNGSIVLSLFVFSIIGLSMITDNHVVFIVITIISLALAIDQFFKDRKELKDAINYSRVKVPFLNHALINISLLTGVICVNIIPNEYSDVLFKGDTLFYVFFVLLSMLIANHYEKFIYSIRSFETGVKLPGGKSEMIRWDSVEEIERKELMVLLKYDNSIVQYKIDSRDSDEFDAIISTWKEGKRSVN